jgi:hypothetical protein
MPIKCQLVFSKVGQDCFRALCDCSRRSLQLLRVSGWRYLTQNYVLIFIRDREEALKDDFPLEDSAYDDEDEEDEWAGDDTAWNDEAEPDDETDVKDEQSAYLEFLNEEVRKWSLARIWKPLTFCRLKSSKIWMTTTPMMSLGRKASSKLLSIRSNLTSSFAMPS